MRHINTDDGTFDIVHEQVYDNIIRCSECGTENNLITLEDEDNPDGYIVCTKCWAEQSAELDLELEKW